MKFIGAITKFIIRTSAFLGKEVAEVLHQPRLILTLVLGPFLILLLFGVGFRYQNPPLRALFGPETAGLITSLNKINLL